MYTIFDTGTFLKDFKEYNLKLANNLGKIYRPLNLAILNRQPETLFVPQMFVPERAYDFHYSIEKRCGKLGRYVSFNEIHVLYRET